MLGTMHMFQQLKPNIASGRMQLWIVLRISGNQQCDLSVMGNRAKLNRDTLIANGKTTELHHRNYLRFKTMAGWKLAARSWKQSLQIDRARPHTFVPQRFLHD